MPAYVAVAAKFVADFIGAAAINSAAYPLIYATAYYGTEIAITAAVSAGLNAVAQSRIPDPEGSKITRRQPRPPRAYMVGGPSRISGAYMHRETNKNYLGVVLALCEGRLDNISGYYLNDDKVTLTGGGWVVGGDDDRYGYNDDRVLIKTRLGLATETHYSDMTAKFASTWPTTARGDGIASLMMICNHGKKENFNQDFPNGEPLPSVVAQPVCYDWRDEAQDREDESTWGPCENPVVWLVFIEWYRHGRNWDRCIAPILDDLTDEANYCDGSVAKVGGTEPRYRCAGNYLSSTEPDAIRTTLLATFDGWLSFNGKGQMVLKAGRYVEPTFTLTAEHITGYTWRAFQTDEEACNELVVSYVSPEKDFTEVECDAWQDQADILATGRVRSENLQLTWVSYFTQARRLAKRKMSRLNAPRRGQIRTTIHGLNGLGERYIRVQNPELSSMADVVLEVMNVEVDLAAAQVVFDVILADENIDDWDPATEEGGPGGTVIRIPGEALDPPTIDTVEAFFDDAGQPRLRVTAYGPDRDDLNWRVGWRVAGDTAFIESTASDLDPSTPVLLETGLVPQGDLEVIVGYETGGGSLVWMDEADAVSVDTTSGLAAPTELAVDVVGSDLAVSWRNPASLTLSYLKVFWGATAVFADATDDSGEIGHTGIGAPQDYTISAPGSGTWYVWVVAYTAADVPSTPAGPVSILVYEPETYAILDEFTTPADDTRAGLYNDLVLALKTAGIWSKLDLLYLRAAADSQAARINLINPGVDTSSIVGTVTFTADRGFTGDGSTGYIDSGRALNALSHGSQNSLCFGAWVLDNATGLQVISAGTRFINPRNASNLVVFSGDGVSLTSAMSDSRGLTVANRSGSSARQTYKDGSLVTSDTTASTSLTSDTFWTLRYSGNYSTHQVAVDVVCSSLNSTEQAALYAALHAYLSDPDVGAV